MSHGGAAFPDLDLVLEANGVRVILVGNTNIKKGITTTNFAATPDVPVSSITVNLPIGPHSALGGASATCAANPLVMPTTITGQNGKVVKQNTKHQRHGCGVQDRRPQGDRQHGLPHREDIRRGTHQRQRHGLSRPVADLQRSATNSGDAEGPARARGRAAGTVST